MTIGTQLQTRRKVLNYTQEYVAEQIHVSRQTISSWENNRSLPDIMSVIRLSDIYDLPLDNLIKGDQDMRNKLEQDEQTRKHQNKLQHSLTGIAFTLMTFSVTWTIDLLFNLKIIYHVMPYFNLSILMISLVATLSFNKISSRPEGSAGHVVKRMLTLIALALIVGSLVAVLFSKLSS